MNDDRNRLFPDLQVPSPPGELRRQALARATEALHAEPTDIWASLWASKPLRLAWAVAIVALAIAHFAVTPDHHPTGPRLVESSGAQLLESLGEGEHRSSPRAQAMTWSQSTPSSEASSGEDSND